MTRLDWLWFDRPVKKTSLRFGVFVLGSSFLALRSLVLGPCFVDTPASYVVSSTIIQMVSRVFISREFASRSSFSIKFANSSDAIPACSVVNENSNFDIRV